MTLGSRECNGGRERQKERDEENARETSMLRDGRGCEKPKTPEGDTARASQPKAVAEDGERREENVCFREEIQ